MAAGAGLGVDLGVEASSGESGAGLGEPGVALPSTLAGAFSFAVALLEAESSSGSLQTVESC